MAKLNSLDDLKSVKARAECDLRLREMGNNPDSYVQVKVAMGDCGIAAGAKGVMTRFIEKASEENIPILVTQTDCMGCCNAEPMAEIQRPKQPPITVGNLTSEKVDELIIKYIKNGEQVDGIIPAHLLKS